ncbi:hypothetical protein F2981_21065 (plasmid) [Sinorhizobium meliloti]|nr:hypothetical protein [Sinorhizobium meliloti]
MGNLPGGCARLGAACSSRVGISLLNRLRNGAGAGPKHRPPAGRSHGWRWTRRCASARRSAEIHRYVKGMTANDSGAATRQNLAEVSLSSAEALFPFQIPAHGPARGNRDGPMPATPNFDRRRADKRSRCGLRGLGGGTAQT